MLTTFEWGLSAPGNVDPSTVGFNCILEGAAPFNCEQNLVYMDT